MLHELQRLRPAQLSHDLAVMSCCREGAADALQQSAYFSMADAAFSVGLH